MRVWLLIIVLLAVLGLPGTFAQDSNYFRAKLGRPSDLYRQKAGAQVIVDYDETGQVCRINISHPPDRAGEFKSFGRLMAVTEELIPPDLRGRLTGTAGELGNCIDVRYEDYERVLIEMNKNACHEHWVRVYFKRDSCPKPPAVRNLLPMKE